MAVIVYILCALAAMTCSTLLFIAWRESRSGMLWWSGVCFFLLTLANVALVVDFFMIPYMPSWPRHALSVAAVSALLYGLIFEER